MIETEKFHELAKDAGNRLRAYILSVSSGATAVFFFALTQNSNTGLGIAEKWLLSISLVAFVITVFLCLYELRVDAKRFFALAKELEKPQDEQSWELNEKYKALRYWLIHTSYYTFGVAIVTTSAYLFRHIMAA